MNEESYYALVSEQVEASFADHLKPMVRELYGRRLPVELLGTYVVRVRDPETGRRYMFNRSLCELGRFEDG